MTIDKVFISCPISQSKEYVLDEYFNCIRNLNYCNTEKYFVDNSYDETYHLKLMAQYGYEIDYCNPQYLTSTMFMCKSMNMILKKFLESDCKWLMLIECDNLPESNIIEQLISHNRMVVSAPYFIRSEADCILMNGEIENGYGNFTNRVPFNWKEDYMKFNGKLEPTSTVGFGTTLIHKSVLEDYQFNVNVQSKAHCDTTFSFDLFNQGIQSYIDNSIIVKHKNQSWKTVTNI